MTSTFRSLLILVSLVSSASSATESPNIVFILADDVAWGDFSCYGNPIHDTPNIDRLAKEGRRFTQAYAPAPICSASRAAILTGKFPARLKFEFVTKNQEGGQTIPGLPLQAPPFTLNLPLKEVTLGEALASVDYATGFFGKWHVSQHYQGYLGWSPTHGPLQQGFAEGSSDFGGHPYAYRKNRALKSQPVPDGEFPEDSLTDQAIAFVEEHRETPFFLYLSHYFVHDPVHSRCEWLIEKYRKRLPKDTLEIRASYAAMIETLDHLVGRVLTTLAEQGLTEQTLVVLTADNGGHPGYTTNAPLRGSKWNLYEGGIRVPTIVRWPGKVGTGSESNTVIHGCDWMPTFRELAGASPVPDAIDGVSLVPLLLRSEALVRSQPLIWHFPFYHPEKKFQEIPSRIGVGDFATSQTRPHSALRKGDRKLIFFHEDQRVELYDLAKDPSELADLSALHPDEAASLKAELIESLNQMNARLPVPVE